jgi:excisionase family DNA binding protein
MDKHSSDDNHLLVPVARAAEMLSISRSKAYQLISEGILPAVRVGSSIRIPLKWLEEWIEEQARVSSHR